MKLARRQSREAAFQVVYCQTFSSGELTRSARSVEAVLSAEPIQQAARAATELRDAAEDTLKVLERLSKALGGRKDGTPPAGRDLPDPMPPSLKLGRVRAETIDSLGELLKTLRRLDTLYAEEGFTGKLLRTYDRNKDQIMTVLDRSLEGWSVRRLTAEDGSLLRLGVTELLYFEDVPPRVIINEYIELAKQYGDADSVRLLNGVLDRVLRDHPRPLPKDGHRSPVPDA